MLSDRILAYNSRFINANTLASLQILCTETSPNAHTQGPSKGVSGSKEGLSVYGLFHHLARTPQGKRLLRQYFLQPTLDLVVIEERLESVAVFSQPDNDPSIRNVVKSLSSIKDIRTVMINLRKGSSGGTSKGGVMSGIWSALRLVGVYQNVQAYLPMITVCIPFATNMGRFDGGDRHRAMSNRTESEPDVKTLMHLTNAQLKILENLNCPNLAYVGKRIGEIVS